MGVYMNALRHNDAAALTGALLLGLTLFGFRPPSAVAADSDLATAILAREVNSPEELSAAFEVARDQWLWIMLPDWEPWTQPDYDQPIPFAVKGFPQEFLDGLVGDKYDDYVLYLLTIVEDPKTRERVFHNADGKEIGAISAPASYDAETLARALGWIDDTGGSDYPYGMHDPARLQLVVTLIPNDQVDAYCKVLEVEAEVKTEKQQGGGMQMEQMWWGGSGLSNLQVVAAEYVASNGSVKLTIGYPDDFTNRMEVLQFDSGPSPLAQLAGTQSWWEVGGANICVDGATNTVAWTNTDLGTSLVFRAYLVANADLDDDSDGLGNLREVYVYHTSTTTNDTDGDTLTDYSEVLTYHTDPNNSDTNKPTAWITFPTNGYRKVWLP